MITVTIPGKEQLEITQAVFDFNGTLGTDGVLESGLAQKIEKLAEKLQIYVVSSDTYGSVSEQCRNLPVEVVVLPKGKGGEEKMRRVMEMGAEKTVCIGNGYNDFPMFTAGSLSLAVIGREGASVKALQHADVVFCNIFDAIDFLLKEQRIIATLRK